VLRHECVSELLLRLHDVEPVLLKQDLGGPLVAELLPFEHELRKAVLQELALACESGVPQTHTSQCVSRM
jgi:hypothetical protein